MKANLLTVFRVLMLFTLACMVITSPISAYAIDGIVEGIAEKAKDIGDSISRGAANLANDAAKKAGEIANDVGQAIGQVGETIKNVVNDLLALLRVRVYMPLALFANTLSTSLAQLFSGVLSDTRWALRTFLLHYFSRSLPETESQVRAIIPAAGELIRLTRALAGGISIISFIFAVAIGSASLLTLSSEGFASMLQNSGKIVFWALAAQIAPIILLLVYGVANQFVLELCGGMQVCANRVDIVNMLIPGPTENPIVQMAAMVVGVVFTGFIALSALLNSLAAFFAYATAPLGVASKGLPATGVVFDSWRDIALRVVIVHVLVALLILAASRYASMVQDRVGKMAIVFAIGLLILLITAMSLALNIGSAANFATSTVASLSQSYSAAGKSVQSALNHSMSATFGNFGMGGADSGWTTAGSTARSGGPTSGDSSAYNADAIRSKYRMHTVPGMVSEAVDVATGKQAQTKTSGGVARQHAASMPSSSLDLNTAPGVSPSYGPSAAYPSGDSASVSPSGASPTNNTIPGNQFAASPVSGPANASSPISAAPASSPSSPAVRPPNSASSVPSSGAEFTPPSVNPGGQAANIAAMAGSSNAANAAGTAASTGTATGAAAPTGASSAGAAGTAGAPAAAAGAAAAAVAVTKIAHDIHEASEFKREGVESIARKVGSNLDS